MEMDGTPLFSDWLDNGELDLRSNVRPLFPTGFKEAFANFRRLLNEGKVRVAEKHGKAWVVNHKVKELILQGFRNGATTEFAFDTSTFYDKDTLPLKNFPAGGNIRRVPGGTSFRDGCYIAENVSVMPPSYVNIGAYIDEHTLLDSHVLVGSCAVVGKRVHLSAGVKLGGVLEPVGNLPVIIEDDVFVGGSCGIYGGVVVGRNAVIGAGTILTEKTPVYDMVRKTVYRKVGANPLTIPAGAVVVPGSRSYGTLEGNEITLQTPVIVKYNSNAIKLEETLRQPLKTTET
jgi:2,3,4,5-tetrahydropyridine-2-carboxylate N-succinyltransferase